MIVRGRVARRVEVRPRVSAPAAAEDPPASEEVRRPEPVDVEALRRDAEERGYAAGWERGYRESLAEGRRAAAEEARRVLEAAEAEREAVLARVREEAADAVCEAVAHLYGEVASREHAVAVVARMLREALPRRVAAVAVAPEDLAAVLEERERLAVVCPDVLGARVYPDEGLVPGECRVETDRGVYAREWRRALVELAEELERGLGRGGGARVP
jgi:flagellar biosynthesis/type III secretory pathway protein FliH